MRIQAKTDGYIKKVNITDFNRVNNGQNLVVIDDGEHVAAVLSAQAQHDEAKANLENLAKEIAARESEVKRAKTLERDALVRLELAAREDDRNRKLLREKAVSSKEADRTEMNLKSARIVHEESLVQIEMQRRQLELLRANAPLREARLKAAAANLKLAQIKLGYTRINAPIAGQSGSVNVKAGDLVKSGTHIVNIEPESPPHIIANFKENQMERIKAGQKAEIKVDTFPGRVFQGVVASIAPATGAYYSLMPIDNTSGNFTKVTQRVPVRIEFISGKPGLEQIKSGVSAEITIDTE